MTATHRGRPVALAQTDRESVGDIAREFSGPHVGCAGDIRTPEQLIGHIERVHHAIDLAIRAVDRLARNTCGCWLCSYFSTLDRNSSDAPANL